MDLVDLLQQLLAQNPASRPSAMAVASHRVESSELEISLDNW